VGQFVRTRRYRLVNDPQWEPDGVHDLTKRYADGESVQLAWATEMLDVDIANATQTFQFKYNGRHIGRAVARADARSIDPEVAAIAAQRGELLRIASAVGQDLDRALPEPVPEPEKCCCVTNCAGPNHSCWGSGLTRATACTNAYSCAGVDCTNAMCIGCCDITPCSCTCTQGDFICACIVSGHSCRCAQWCN
jgi:hypothetical protein